MREVTILCEGPTCNNGIGAKAREAMHIPTGASVTDIQRGYAEDRARALVSRELRYTPHVRCGIGRHGMTLYACTACQHERVYGNTTWATGL